MSIRYLLDSLFCMGMYSVKLGGSKVRPADVRFVHFCHAQVSEVVLQICINRAERSRVSRGSRAITTSCHVVGDVRRRERRKAPASPSSDVVCHAQRGMHFGCPGSCTGG